MPPGLANFKNIFKKHFLFFVFINLMQIWSLVKRLCKTCLTCYTVRTLDFKVYALNISEYTENITAST